MANEESSSAFRSALTQGSGHIVNSAFPQIGLLLDMLRDQSSKKDKDEAKDEAGPARRRGGSGFNSSAVQIIDEGFNELHGDLQVTNIILNSSLEEHRKTSKLLEKLLLNGGSGGGGGLGGGAGGGITNVVEDVGLLAIAKKMFGGGKSLLGGTASVAEGLGGSLAGALAPFLILQKQLFDEIDKKVANGDLKTNDDYHWDWNRMSYQEGKTPTATVDNTQIDASIAALTKQIDNLNNTIKEMKKAGQDTATTEGIKNELEQRLKDKKEAKDNDEGKYDDFITRHPPAITRDIAQVALPQSPDDRDHHNPLQPTFDGQGVDASNSRVTPGLEQIQRKMGGQSTIQSEESSKSGAVNTQIPGEGRALLDTIASSESPNYNVLYGGSKFTSYDDHPRQRMLIRSGPNAGQYTTAAGRYQFLSTTWDAEAKKLGLKDFSPANQDRAAWDLAETTYKQQTHHNLLDDLKSNDPNVIANVGRVLHSTWTSLPGGIEQGQNANLMVSRFNKNLEKISKEDNNSNNSEKKQALLAAGTNDWGDSNKAYSGVKESLQVLKDKGYDPILVLPNKNIHGSSAAHDGALKAATELGVKTEYPSSFETGSESYHIDKYGAAAIKAKYPGVPAFGDSNGDRLGAREGITGFQGKGSEEIAAHLKNIAAVATNNANLEKYDSSFRPVNDRAFQRIAKGQYLDYNNITANFKDGPMNINNRLNSPALDFSNYQPENIAPLISQAGVDNAAKMVSNRGSNSVKSAFVDHTNKSGSPDDRSNKDKNNAGPVAPPDERIKKLFDNYSIIGHH